MNSIKPEELAFQKSGGLLPVVAQDSTTREVLMVAFANREAVEASLRTGYAHYFSRTRNKLWKKGESSGNLQKIVDILVDCDNDTLLYVVEQRGAACHLGTKTCFNLRLAKSEPQDSL